MQRREERTEKKDWSQNVQTINIDDAFCVSFEFPGKPGQNVIISYQIILPLSPLITTIHSHRMHLYYIIQAPCGIRYTAYMYSRCAIIMFGFYSVKHSKQKAKRTSERLNYLCFRMWWANCVFLFKFLHFQTSNSKASFLLVLKWLITDFIVFRPSRMVIVEMILNSFFLFSLFQDQTQ